MKVLALITFIRGFYLLALLAQGFGIFSDDGSTRLLLAQEWSASAWISPQIPWLPLQFYLVGGISSVTGFPTSFVGVGLNALAVLAIPWVFYLTLPTALSQKEKLWSLAVVSLLPWALWPGLSGLSDPLMWILALLAWHFYLSKKSKWFILSIILLTMTRIEAWIWAGVLVGFSVFRLYQSREMARLIWLCVVTSLWPAFWLIHQELLAFSVRSVDATLHYGDSFFTKIFLFPFLIFITAPCWVIFFFKKKNIFDNLNFRPILVFLGCFWGASTFVGLSTAVAQRNVVLPLILLCPYLVKHTKPLGVAFVLLAQLWILFHPENSLRLDLQQERSYLANLIRTFQHEEKEKPHVLVQLQEKGHAYLPRHLALRGIEPNTLWVNHSPRRLAAHAPNQWVKYMTYEKASEGDHRLINHWRSFKPGESILKTASKNKIKDLLKANHIGCIITPVDEKWPLNIGYTYPFLTRDHKIWFEHALKNQNIPEFVNTDTQARSRSRLLKKAIAEKKIDRNFFKALLSLTGI